jgi:hypothetical protein
MIRRIIHTLIGHEFEEHVDDYDGYSIHREKCRCGYTNLTVEFHDA